MRNIPVDSIQVIPFVHLYQRGEKKETLGNEKTKIRRKKNTIFILDAAFYLTAVS